MDNEGQIGDQTAQTIAPESPSQPYAKVLESLAQMAEKTDTATPPILNVQLKNNSGATNEQKLIKLEI